MANKLILDNGDQTINIGFDAEVVGSNATETVVVSAGADVSFAAGDNDRVEVAGNLADYTVTANGANGLTLTHTDGSVINLSGLTTTGATVAFADGSAPVAVNLDTTNGTLAPTLGGIELALDGTALDNNAVTLNDTDGGNSGGQGQTFNLTADTDVETLTSGNDTVVAAQGALNDADVILDNSTSDSDVLNAEVTTAGTKARIQNVETVNIDGKFALTGFDLADTANTTNLNVDTAIVSGTATVTNASSLNAMNINAGANINTMNVTATASGTRDTVNVDAGSAATVNINGFTGTDSFDVTVAENSTTTLDINTGTADIDSYAVNTVGGAYTLGGDAQAKSLTINNTTEAATVTLATGQTLVGSGATSAYAVSGDKAVTLVTADSTDVDGMALTDTNTESTTLKITDSAIAAAEADLNKFAVDTVELSATGTDVINVTVNEVSVVNLTGDVTADDDVTLNVDNAAGTVDTAAGALVVNVSESQTVNALTTGAKVGTLVVNATPDEVADTANDAVITVAEINTDTANTDTVVVQGSNDLTITTLTNNAGGTVSATDMTGKLTIDDVANDATIALGSGGSKIVATGAVTIHGGTGKDVLTGGAGVDTLNGNDGDDTLWGAGGADAISTGAGTDTVDGGAGADTITLGAGADTVSISAGEDGDTIKSFTVGEDKLILTGDSAGTADLNLTQLTATAPTDGTYQVLGTTFDFTLTGVNLTDLSDVVQLGNATTQFDVGSGTTIVASDFADNILADGAGVTITGGLGADKIELASAGNTDTVVVAAGDSTADAYDMVTNYIVNEDVIDLASATVATNAGDGSEVDGTDVGVFAQHEVASGVITFENTAGDDITLTIGNFESAVDYLEANIADGDTVAFEFAGNTYLFQGNATSDVMIELTGLTSVTAVADSAGAATIQIA